MCGGRVSVHVRDCIYAINCLIFLHSENCEQMLYDETS